MGDMTHTHRLTHLGSISASTNKYPALISHVVQQSALCLQCPLSLHLMATTATTI